MILFTRLEILPCLSNLRIMFPMFILRIFLMFVAQEVANDFYDVESYDSEDSLEISLSYDLDTCCVFGQDATMDDSYGDELAIVPYVKNEFFSIEPTLDFPIILLKSPTHIPENFSRIKSHSDGL